MIRLHIIAEGQTEQKFVEKVLAPHLLQFQIITDSRCVLTSKDKKSGRTYRGGMNDYQKPKKDIQTWMKEDDHPECRFTTMFDYYALPDDFPGYTEAIRKPNKYESVQEIESAFKNDMNHYKFIPYIQLHEFEALILASPQNLDWEYLEHDIPIKNLIAMVSDSNPELINDGRETAPSKRILLEIPEYDKVTAGVSVAENIGLQVLRDKCRHFNEWLTKLENLSRDVE